MAKFFTFADRFVPIQFFEEDPVKLTLKISDETDKRLLKASEAFVAADKQQDMDTRRDAYRTALESFIGKENADAILSRTDEPDCFAIYSVFKYLVDTYGAQKAKNLSASALTR